MAFNPKFCFGGIPLGIAIRGQIAKQYIFRITRGNGYGGSIQGKRYQNKYSYFVPTSINNTESDPARTALAQAVGNWQTSLSQEQKAEYNRRASKGLHMSGYNLYIREYILANT